MHPYSSIDTTAAWKKLRFILSVRSDFHMIESLSIAVHAFVSRVSMSLRRQLYGHLPPITKTIQVRRARHAGPCWRSKDELVSDVLLWTPTYGQAKAGRPSLATSPYHSSPPAGLQDYILCPHIVAVCKFVLVVLLLHIHMWGSTGVHRLWARPCFSSSVPRVWFV